MGILDGIIKGVADATLGPDPRVAANSYKNLMTEINSRYDTQKQQFEADPNNAGKQYSLPDPLTRWRDQVDAMIGSGDPILQKEGLAMLSQYQQTANSPTTNTTPDAVRQYQFAQSQGYQGSFEDWKKMLSKQSGTSVHVSVGTGSEGINFLTPEQKQGLGIGQDSPVYVDKNGIIREAPGAKDLATQQQTNVTNTSLDESESILFDKGGIYDMNKEVVDSMNLPPLLRRPAEAAVSFAQQYKQDDPRYAQIRAINSNLAATIGRAYLGEKGVMTEEDVARINKLLPDPINDNPVTARAKMTYLRKLVKVADPTKVKEMVYQKTEPPISKGTEAAVGNAVKPNVTVEPKRKVIRYQDLPQ